ncbi:hypothetical protein DYB36_011848 [Aphanomyces astaci]|uniref:Radical SAM C-terminal extension domain-containing protein n=1 Tax=Aphanomyces astaci TaxID=112090 RepID=A0A397AP49_APHAT|nr:hypothetical protein DYB36_011848 [Aphanomyces astaci]
MERDLSGFKEYFENPLFRTDGLKIYPTLVIRGTGLYELWKTGHYKGVACRDIRTREVGMKGIHDQISPDQVELVRRDYVANGGYY